MKRCLSILYAFVGLIVGAVAGGACAFGLTIALMLLNPDNGIAGMLFIPVGLLTGAVAGSVLANNRVSQRATGT